MMIALTWPPEQMHRWLLPGVFAVAILAALLFEVALPSGLRGNESSDYISFYEPVAQNILAGRGLVDGQNQPAVRYPPGYPLLLAATFAVARPLGLTDEMAAYALNLAGIGVTSALLFCLARTIWGLVPALVGTAVWITYPVALWLTKQPNSEIPFMVLFYSMVYLLYRTLRGNPSFLPAYLVVGMLAGLAALIRPIAVGVSVVLCLVVWLSLAQPKARVRLCIVATMLFGNLIVVAPWEGWLYAKTNSFIMLSTASVPAMRDGLTFVNPKEYRQAIPVPTDVAQVMGHLMAKSRELQSPGDVILALKTEWQTDPPAVVKLFVLKVARSWYATDSGRLENLILLVQLGYLTLIVVGSWMAWKQGGGARWFAVGIWLLALYFWAMTVMALSILRYMVPILGLLVMLIPACLIRVPLPLNRLHPHVDRSKS